MLEVYQVGLDWLFNVKHRNISNVMFPRIMLWRGYGSSAGLGNLHDTFMITCWHFLHFRSAPYSHFLLSFLVLFQLLTGTELNWWLKHFFSWRDFKFCSHTLLLKSNEQFLNWKFPRFVDRCAAYVLSRFCWFDCIGVSLSLVHFCGWNLHLDLWICISCFSVFC